MESIACDQFPRKAVARVKVSPWPETNSMAVLAFVASNKFPARYEQISRTLRTEKNY
jgi:hypothetical protein